MDKVETMGGLAPWGHKIAKKMPPFPFYMRGNSGALWEAVAFSNGQRTMHNGEPMVSAQVIADGKVGFMDTVHADQLLAMYGEFNKDGQQIKTGYLDDVGATENRGLAHERGQVPAWARAGRTL